MVHKKTVEGLLQNGKEYDYCKNCDYEENVVITKGYSKYYVKSFSVSKGKKAITTLGQ